MPCAARPIPKGRKANSKFVQGAGRRARYVRIKSALPWGREVPLLEAAHERFAGVSVDCRPWQEFIRRWHRPGTLFYLDPPYWGTEHYYGRGLFGREQFAELSAALQGFQGRFILSLNDVPEVRELFAWAQIETVELSYQAGGAENTKRVRDLVITRRGT
ncbi:MAG: DNA adenine methylase [Bosea sp.]|uniref:DNA adenine methylase n=1 Tax=Bosea sp. (in: a-proteobacteria) TaxID=1871050 RepID=UPI001AC7F6E8|nr:DNA adenine methylase [Bosea sp. (in: a-proteobacteria)]MBN9467714.1 DNA adenine methylase [Bosea sp. (in: a-proteobacteria)]